MPLPIETERLVLRRFQDQDLMNILEYSSSLDFWIARNLDWQPTEKGVRKYWETQRDNEPEGDPSWFALVIELKDQGKVIGNIGIGVIKTGGHKQGTIGGLMSIPPLYLSLRASLMERNS